MLGARAGRLKLRDGVTICLQNVFAKWVHIFQKDSFDNVVCPILIPVNNVSRSFLFELYQSGIITNVMKAIEKVRVTKHLKGSRWSYSSLEWVVVIF